MLLFTTGLEAKELSLSEVMRATCRVNADRINQLGQKIGESRGTGTIISEDDTYYYVMTNGHVASNKGSTVYLEFFNEGYKSAKIPAQVYWRYYESNTSKDAALIKLAKTNLNGYVPVVIPMAPEDHATPVGTKIYGAGYPKGMWLSAWIARVASMADQRMFFDMTPQPGQSGTAILSKVTIDGEDYTRVSGMLSWHYESGNETYGGAIHLKRLYELFATNAPDDTGFLGGVSTEIACDHCKHELRDHYVIRLKDGSIYTRFGKVQHFCPLNITTLRSNVSLGLYGEGAKLVRRVTDFPVFPDDPKLEDIDPKNDKPLFPIAPAPPVEDNSKELKKRIGVLERLKESIENKLKDAVEDKKKDSDKYKSLKGLHDTLTGENEQLNNKNVILGEDNKGLVQSVEDWEKKNSALLSRLEELAKSKEDWLNNITVPYMDTGLGSLLVFLLGALASGTLGATMMSKYIQPFMIRRFGWFPTKIALAIVKRKYPVASKPLFKTIPKGSEDHTVESMDVVDSDEIFDIKPPDKE